MRQAAGVQHRLIVVPGDSHAKALGEAAWKPTIAFLDDAFANSQ